MTGAERRTVHPGGVVGTLRAPPSKSVLQRAIAAASLAKGLTRLRVAPPFSDDARAALRVIRALGARVEESEARLEIEGGHRAAGSRLDCGEAGLSLRMFTSLAALHDVELTLLAHGSLARRPIDMAIAPLRALGARCRTAGGRPPVMVCGPLRGGEVEVDGSVSSQFLTGLLMALPCCAEDSTVRVRGLKSKPYVALTIALMERFGVELGHDPEMTRFHVRGGQQYRARELDIEGDWSGATFPLIAAAVSGEVTVTGLDLASAQADRRILEALERAGAQVNRAPDGVSVRHRGLHAFPFDATHAPDLFPPLVALATSCRGTSLLLGAERLRHKESDRAETLVREFGKLGGALRAEGDRLLVEGQALRAGTVEAHGDHRIAMALAVAATRAAGPVTIEGAGCVSKSYPNFWNDLAAIGVRVGANGAEPPAAVRRAGKRGARGTDAPERRIPG